MPESRTGRGLRRLVRLACARPSLTVALAIVLAALSVAYALRELSFKTSNLALLPQGQAYVERFKEYDREFGELDDLVIVVEAPSSPEAIAYASRLVRELRTQHVPLRRIAYRVDPKQFEGKALLYLPKEQLAEIRDKIFDYQELMEAFAGRPTLDQLVEGVATQLATSFVSHMFDIGLTENTRGANDLRFIRDLADQVAGRIDRPVKYRSPWGGLFAVEGHDEASAGYFFSDDEKLLFILAVPQSEVSSFTGEREAIDGIRAVIRSLRGEFPDVHVGVTGKAALSNDEMTAAFRDSERATYVAFGLTLGLLLLAFLRVGKPIVMLVVLALSLCWSIGVTTLVIGHLSLFSVMFISIVIGIGIDYGIYYLFRYEEELYLGRAVGEAIEITAARSGPGMLLGAVTAAGTFYVLMLTDFRGIQELGFIAGTALLLAWLAMMTVFPAALVLIDRRRAGQTAGHVPRALALERIHVPVVEHLAGQTKTVLALAAVLTIVAIVGFRGVGFDYNLLNLQAEGTESVAWEKRILKTAGRSGFSALATATSMDELRQKNEAFGRLSSVSRIDSALLVIPKDQEEKRKILADVAPIVGPVRIGRPLSVDIDRLIAAWETLKRRLDFAASEAPAGDAQRELKRASDDVGRVIRKLRQTDRPVSEAALTHLQHQLYRDFVRNFQRLQANVNPGVVGLAQLPAEIRRKFVSDRGRFLLQIHPAVDIWDREGATRFVSDLRAIDPEVTGTPVITYEAIRLMERAYQQGTVYAIILVSVVTALVIRRARETALALLPLGLGMLWTVGLMYFLGLKFSLGNVFGLPLILGAAAEYGLNIMLRFIEDREHGGPLIARSTVMAVLVSGLTTIVGFGTLLLAQHRGIFSLGLLLTLGTAVSLFAALVVLPVMLRLVQPPRRATPPPRPTEPAAVTP